MRAWLDVRGETAGGGKQQQGRRKEAKPRNAPKAADTMAGFDPLQQGDTQVHT